MERNSDHRSPNGETISKSKIYQGVVAIDEGQMPKGIDNNSCCAEARQFRNDRDKEIQEEEKGQGEEF